MGVVIGHFRIWEAKSAQLLHLKTKQYKTKTKNMPSNHENQESHHTRFVLQNICCKMLACKNTLFYRLTIFLMQLFYLLSPKSRSTLNCGYLCILYSSLKSFCPSIKVLSNSVLDAFALLSCTVLMCATNNYTCCVNCACG